MRFHPRGNNYLVAAVSTTLYILDINACKNNSSSSDNISTRTINTTHSRNISSIDWSPDGAFLVASSDDMVTVYETQHWKKIASQSAQTKISGCAFVQTRDKSGGNNGQLNVAYGEYETICLWQFHPSGNSPKHVQSAQSGMVVGIASVLRPDGQTLMASASHSKNKNLMIWTTA
jgi:WD40 repeat protein